MKHILLIGSILLMSSCATPYQPKGMTGGFSSTQLDTNVFKVSFNGNRYTDRERANDFALLRSAEIAIDNGFKYFVIVDSKESTKTSLHTTPTTATTSVNANTYGSVNNYGSVANYNSNTYGTATTTVSGGQTYTISKPNSTNTVVYFNEKPEGFVYNAEFILKSLKEKYGIENLVKQ